MAAQGDRIATAILTTRRAAREDDWAGVGGPIAEFVFNEMGVRSSVGSPIVVKGEVWGAVFVHSKQPHRPLPQDTELRLATFAELVATAISNAQARSDVGRLADEQAALRRVATLVARASPPEEVFAAAAAEVARLLQVEMALMYRYDDDGAATVVGYSGDPDGPFRVGARMPLDGENVAARVRRTEQPARIDDYPEKANGPIGDRVRGLGFRSAVGSPIAVGGRLWGGMIVSSRQTAALPPETESRIGDFTELLATAISNVETRAQLAASRARLVAARRRRARQVVRDLHDGAQQRLVHTVITLKLACRALAEDDETARGARRRVARGSGAGDHRAARAGHGILPSVLTRGGLRAGLEALASRMPVPVELDVSADRLPATVEATGYFVVAEALTNVAKHARATSAKVLAQVDDGMLRVEVRDDGVGGARPDGSGLVGDERPAGGARRTALPREPARRRHARRRAIPIRGQLAAPRR